MGDAVTRWRCYLGAHLHARDRAITGSSPIPLRTLIVDDHPLFGESLRLLLGATLCGEIVCCSRADEALRLAAQAPFDLVLLDWNLGTGVTAEAVLEAMKAELPHTRVVIVSGETGASVVRRAIEGGASGYVPKSSTPALLVDALTVIAHGGVYLPRMALDDSEDPPPAATRVPTLQRIADAFPQLSERRVEVLDLLARGMSNKQIARVLDISDGTVKQHLNAIFREIDVSSRTEALYLMARRGVRFD